MPYMKMTLYCDNCEKKTSHRVSMTEKCLTCGKEELQECYKPKSVQETHTSHIDEKHIYTPRKDR
jgi:ribosomal protein L37AE/L43A